MPRCLCTRFLQGGEPTQPLRVAGYASRLEAQRAAELWALQQRGVITELREQVDLFDDDHDGRRRSFKVDFAYREGRVLVFEDAKGMWSASFTRKWHLVMSRLARASFRLAVRVGRSGIKVIESRAPLEAA